MKQAAFISALKFVAHAKAKNDVRYYLNSVKFEFKAEVLTLIATDGHRMAWAEVEAPDLPDAEYLIDGAHVDTVLKTFKAGSTGSLVLEFGHERLLIQAADSLAVARYVDGTFPNWRRVITPGVRTPDYNGGPKGINCEYLAQAGAAFKPLTGKWGRTLLDIGRTETDCIRLTTVPSVAGVLSAECIIMPMKGV